MTRRSDELAGLVPLLATLLSGGTLVSCALIALGMVVSLAGGFAAAHAGALMSVGVVLLLLLPPLRVLATATWFLHRRDYPFALVALLVLAIVVAATVLGLEVS